MTAAQFAQYSLLVSGDPFCSATPASTTSNAATWAPVVMGNAGGNTQAGNRTLIGTDPESHYAAGGGGAQPTNPADPSTAGAEHLMQAGMKFAGDGPAGTTGMYFDTSCGDNGQDIATLNMLTTTGTGWTEDPSVPCGGSVQQIATVAEFSIVSDSDIQGWSCSDHITYPAFPAEWNAEAVATDTSSHPTCGTDPSTSTTACGEAYVILAGKGITTTAPDLALTPLTATDPVGGNHTVTATVTQSGSPVAGAAVTFNLASGPNAGASGTCTFSNSSADPGCTGSDGEVLFTYHDGNGAGTDTIDASVTLGGSTEHATAMKTWAASSSGCTMTSTSKSTVFSSSAKPIHIENVVNSDVTQPQHVVVRSLSGPAQYFSLTSLTAATCHDNTSFPTEEGGAFNTFTGDGTGAFGTGFGHTTAGYSIHFEISDRGDGGAVDNPTVDKVDFQITKGGTLVWSASGTLTAGSEEDAG